MDLGLSLREVFKALGWVAPKGMEELRFKIQRLRERGLQPGRLPWRWLGMQVVPRLGCAG